MRKQKVKVHKYYKYHQYQEDEKIYFGWIDSNKDDVTEGEEEGNKMVFSYPSKSKKNFRQ